MKYFCNLLMVLFLLSSITFTMAAAKAPRFKALLCYSLTEEPAHQEFGRQAVDFFKDLTIGNCFILDVTTDLSGYDYEKLSDYDVIISANLVILDKDQREAFEKYMENGGGWIGFHASGYNDHTSQWPWFNKFLGCGTFLRNNWPPQPALLDVNMTDHPVTKNLPDRFVAPKNEWYMWNEAPDTRANVDVLLSVSPKNYPLGIKDIVDSGEYPVVWTNRDYRMIYLNFGHGDRGFTDPTQNLLIINALRWIASCSPKGDPFKHQ